jgi:hypothetical protein
MIFEIGTLTTTVFASADASNDFAAPGSSVGGTVLLNVTPAVPQAASALEAISRVQSDLKPCVISISHC